MSASIRRSAPAFLRYAAALAAVSGMSAMLGFILSVSQITRISILYLVVVLAAAIWLGRGPAIFASIAAILIYDWFFTVPYHELTILDPQEWISLFLFLITAIITAELAGNVRVRALQAERREREATVLFDALRLMSGPDLDSALTALAERVRGELRIEAVGIDLSIDDEAHTSTAGSGEAASLLRRVPSGRSDLMRTGREPTASQAGSAGGWVRVIPTHRLTGYEVQGRWRRHVVAVRVGDRNVGRLTLLREASGPEFGALENRFLNVIATQLGILVERAESQRAAADAEILRQANELKSAVLNAVSHDLRTPLASIMASAGSLLQHDVPWADEDRDAFALVIKHETERLNRIVGNLLDLSRLESGVLRPEKELHEIGVVIHDVVGRLAARGGGHRVNVHVAQPLPPVPLDYVEIDQVLSNLIENALKYSPEGSAVDVEAQATDDGVLVSVADRGPGVPAAEMTHLFEPFYRVRGSTVHRTGLGLGLAVAKGLITAHGGRIWVEPREGGGTWFAFTLSASDAAPIASATSAARA